MDRVILLYPEILFSFLCFVFLLALHRRRIARGTLTNWPVFGMLPGLTVNIHRLHDLSTDIFCPARRTFLFLGPWFSGMKFLITCDPADVNHVFNTNFHNYPKGHEFSEIFDILGNGIFNADGVSWLRQRKKAQMLVANPRFRAFAAHCCRDKVNYFLLPLLRQISKQGKAVDLHDIFLRFSFDVTSKLVFGADLVSLSPDFTVVPFSKAIDEAMVSVLHRHMFPASWWKLMRRLNLGREKTLAEAWRVIDKFIAESITNKRKETRDSADDSLLSSYIKDTSEAYEESRDDDEFLRDTTLSLMIAGRDTVGVALAWFFYLLCRNPVEEEKVVNDISRGEAAEGEEPAYLQAALCEALRLYPPVPFEAKGVLEAETLPSGERVEPGMQVFFSAYTMGRIETVWGKDCLDFRPERWLTEQGKLRRQPSYKFLSFNCGPRTCLGKDVAFVIMTAAAAAVLREFRFEIVEGHAVKPKFSIILQMRNGMKVRVMKRQ